MRRLVIAALVVAAVGVVAASAGASNGNRTSVTYEGALNSWLPTNLPSVGPEAYGFASLGDQITFPPGTPRKLSSVVVTLSSWACVKGHWMSGDCHTPAWATFSQPITLKIYDAADPTKVDPTRPIAESTQTFHVPYRPSASPKCVGTDRPGGWYQFGTKKCYNGLATDVTFYFAGRVTLPETVVYSISYNTSHSGPSPIGAGTSCFGTVAGCPYDSLNIGLITQPSVGVDPDPTTVWRNGAASPALDLDNMTPAVQFKAGGRS
jgi:hypothetical protein